MMYRLNYPGLFGNARCRALFNVIIAVCLPLNVCLPALASSTGKAAPGEKTVIFHPQFDRDIRPILAENCYPCHGPDANKRKAKMRLDLGESALEPLPNGDVPIVAGKPSESKVIERIT